MSLKTVHLVFVTAATMLALWCGAQALQAFRATGSPTMGTAVVGAILTAGVLVGYERRFLRRCREAGIR
ncbi:MAG: hypothetical protein QM736_16055 [Vicinamibacterales bacterium]